MSDNEMIGSSDDEHFYDDDDDEEFESIRREHEASQRAREQEQASRTSSSSSRRTQRRQPSPPLAGSTRPPGGIGGGLFGPGRDFASMLSGGMGMGMGPGSMFGGPGMTPSPESFRASYVAFSTSIHEASEGRMDRVNGGRQNLMFGGNILMPPEALDQLTRMDIEGPWTFDLVNPVDSDRHTFAGVLEFTAEPGRVYLPQWMMNHLGFAEGSNIRINGASLPKGKFVKLEPQELHFLDLADPKAVLEKALSHFPCLTLNSIVEISHQHIQLSFKILDIKPDHKPGVEIRNTDIEVDFAPPVGYVPPQPKPREPAPTMASKLGINVDAAQDDAEEENNKKKKDGFGAFVGTGNSIGGKRIKGKGTKGRKIESLPENSRVRRTDRETFVNANNMPENAEVPAPLRLPFGHLFFGYPLIPSPRNNNNDGGESSAGQSQTEQSSFQGQGATLSGRSRQPAPSALGQQPQQPPKSEDDSKFAGSGNTLGARKPDRKVIEIDDDD